MALPVAFLSHATKDRELASRLARDLRKDGINVWYSDWEIRPGDSLRMKIDEGIDSAEYFLVLLTSTSLSSKWVQTELDAGLVNRILGKCRRLIPILSGVSLEEVPATLRGLLCVPLDDYDQGLRKVVAACFEVASRPPLGAPPAWARERPLEGAGLSSHAQRLAHWINQRSKDGSRHEYFERDALIVALSLTVTEIGLAARELEKRGYVRRCIDSGSGPARFSELEVLPQLFYDTDPLLQPWNPEHDAVDAATAMINLSRGGDGVVSLERLDAHLGWGPRRLNPAADFLRNNGHVGAIESVPCAPYSYSDAVVTHDTHSFVETAQGRATASAQREREYD